MFTLFSLLFSLHLGGVGAPHEDAVISFRAEAHAAAREAEERSAPLVQPPSSLAAVPEVSPLPLQDANAPALGPALLHYRPDEWVAAVTRRLNIQDHPVARAAMFLATIPVELDMRPPDRVYAKVTVRGF